MNGRKCSAFSIHMGTYSVSCSIDFVVGKQSLSTATPQESVLLLKNRVHQCYFL